MKFDKLEIAGKNKVRIKQNKINSENMQLYLHFATKINFFGPLLLYNCFILSRYAISSYLELGSSKFILTLTNQVKNTGKGKKAFALPL